MPSPIELVEVLRDAILEGRRDPDSGREARDEWQAGHNEGLIWAAGLVGALLEDLREQAETRARAIDETLRRYLEQLEHRVAVEIRNVLLFGHPDGDDHRRQRFDRIHWEATTPWQQRCDHMLRFAGVCPRCCSEAELAAASAAEYGDQAPARVGGLGLDLSTPFDGCPVLGCHLPADGHIHTGPSGTEISAAVVDDLADTGGPE